MQKQHIATFIGTQLDRIRQERKRFDVRQVRKEASALAQKLTSNGMDPATAHQHVEDALRYLAFFLADSALHSQAVAVGFLLNVHRMKCEKNLGLMRKYVVKCVSRCLIGFTHRPLRLAVASISVWVFFAILFHVLSQLSGQPTLIASYKPEASLSWFHYPYFSAVTLTTTGYGDICPSICHPWAFWVALACSLEAVCGYLLLGALVAMLLQAAGIHPYARLSQWHKEFEAGVLGLTPPKAQDLCLYNQTWKGYASTQEPDEATPHDSQPKSD